MKDSSNETGNDLRAFTEAARQRKEKRRADNTELAEMLAGVYGLEIEKFNSGSQIRLSNENKHLDFFPTTGKIHVNGKFIVADLEKQIKVRFDL